MRTGLIGCGVIAGVYARKLNALADLDLVACADALPGRAAEFAAEHGVPRAPDVDVLLADPDVDAVLNLTIPAAHVDISTRAIEAGKHVYSEKPLALDAAGAHHLVQLAADHRVRLGCAPDTFLGAGLQTCRALIDAGAIGTPVAANGFMLSPGPERWHPGPQIFYQRGAGPLFDMGPYYLTALVNLLGPARRITAAARITHAERTIGSEPMRGQKFAVEVPTHVTSVIDFEAGPIATLVTSFDVQATRQRWIEIYGTEGTLAVPDPNTFGGPVQIKHNPQDDWQDLPLSHANADQARGIGLADMAHALATGRPHRASGELAAHVMELMESAVRASDSGRHVDITSRCQQPAPLPPGLADNEFN